MICVIYHTSCDWFLLFIIEIFCSTKQAIASVEKWATICFKRFAWSVLPFVWNLHREMGVTVMTTMTVLGAVNLPNVNNNTTAGDKQRTLWRTLDTCLVWKHFFKLYLKKKHKTEAWSFYDFSEKKERKLYLGCFFIQTNLWKKFSWVRVPTSETIRDQLNGTQNIMGSALIHKQSGWFSRNPWS